MTRVITIRLEVPEGVEVHFGTNPVDGPQDDPLPMPDWPEPADAGPGFETLPTHRAVSAGGSCPVHRLPWRTVPAGIAKRTGRPYAAFAACPETGCLQRPPVSRRTA